jgi:hypothetical protein
MGERDAGCQAGSLGSERRIGGTLDRPGNGRPDNDRPGNGRAWLAGAGVAGVLLVSWFFVAWLGLRRNAVDAAGESVGSGFVLLCLAVLIGVIRANGWPGPAARHLPGPVSAPAPRR